MTDEQTPDEGDQGPIEAPGVPIDRDLGEEGSGPVYQAPSADQDVASDPGYDPGVGGRHNG